MATLSDDKWGDIPSAKENPLANNLVETVPDRAISRKRTRQGQSVHVTPSSLYSKQCTVESTKVVPENVRNDYFTTNTYCDIQITGSQIETVYQCLIEIEVRNTDAISSTILSQPWNWFRYISELPNGNSESVYHYPLDLKEELLNTCLPTMTRNCELLNLLPPFSPVTTTFESENALAAAGTNGDILRVFIPFDTGVVTSHTFWPLVKVFPRIRLYFSQSQSVFAPLAGHTNLSSLDIQDIQFYMTGCKYHGRSKLAVKELYSKPYVWQAWKPARMLIDINGINSREPTGYIYLNSIQGRFMSLHHYVYLRSDLNTPGGLEKYVNILDYTLRTSGGRVLGFEEVPAAVMQAFSKFDKSLYKQFLAQKQVPAAWGAGNIPIKQFGPYFDHYTDNWRQAKETGGVFGAMEFNSKDTVQYVFGTLQDGTPLAADDLQLHIQGLQRCQYKFNPDGGKFELIRL